jgi:hypothetical protein
VSFVALVLEARRDWLRAPRGPERDAARAAYETLRAAVDAAEHEALGAAIRADQRRMGAT